MWEGNGKGVGGPASERRVCSFLPLTNILPCPPTPFTPTNQPTLSVLSLLPLTNILESDDHAICQQGY